MIALLLDVTADIETCCALAHKSTAGKLLIEAANQGRMYLTLGEDTCWMHK